MVCIGGALERRVAEVSAEFDQAEEQRRQNEAGQPLAQEQLDVFCERERAIAKRAEALLEKVGIASDRLSGKVIALFEASAGNSPGFIYIGARIVRVPYTSGYVRSSTLIKQHRIDFVAYCSPSTGQVTLESKSSCDREQDYLKLSQPASVEQIEKMKTDDIFAQQAEFADELTATVETGAQD